jgi:hypothetical protein
VAALVTGAALVSCAKAPLLGWPADVRAAHERGPEIRPPEEWAHPEAADAFHARGWFVLTESWIADEDAGRVGHCWTGTVRTIGDAGGDVVASDFSEHGLPEVRMGETAEHGELLVYADDHTFAACVPEPGVAEAVSRLGAECAAFGEAIAILDDAIDAPPHAAELAMNAIELTLVVRWREAALAADRTIRRLTELGFEGEVAGQIGDPPRMRRTDDDWEVAIELPPHGEDEVVLRARSAVPRRPICGPEPLPPPRRHP